MKIMRRGETVETGGKMYEAVLAADGRCRGCAACGAGTRRSALCDRLPYCGDIYEDRMIVFKEITEETVFKKRKKK